MKKISAILCILLLATLAEAGARHRWEPAGSKNSGGRSPLVGTEYHNFSLTWQTIDLSGKNTLIFAPTIRGVAFTFGHSFLIHERPLLRVVSFGFDATWLDIEYGRWSKKIGGDKKWMHKIDMAIGIGPAIHVNPFERFRVQAYFHYNPTLSMVTHNFAGDEEGKFELVAGYATYFSTGLVISSNIFSVGAEYRHGSGRYKGIRSPDVTISPDRIDEIFDLEIKDALDSQRHTMRGWRVYFGFRC
jgi:hypothetical protein